MLPTLVGSDTTEEPLKVVVPLAQDQDSQRQKRNKLNQENRY